MTLVVKLALIAILAVGITLNLDEASSSGLGVSETLTFANVAILGRILHVSIGISRNLIRGQDPMLWIIVEIQFCSCIFVRAARCTVLSHVYQYFYRIN